MEIPISQDIRKFKTKDIGNFNFKEVGWLVLALGAGVITYKLTGDSLEYAPIPMMIILAIGFIKPFGLSFLQFLKTVVKEDVLSPRTYINETDFEYTPDEFDDIYGEPIIVPENYNELAKGTNPDKPQPEKITLSKNDLQYFAK